MKAPAFQWYPKEFDTDEAVILMDNACVGAYVRLLNFSWLNEGIPCDVEAQARIVREPVSRWRKMWPTISPKWSAHPSNPSRLVNPKQEAIRVEQSERKARLSENGKLGAAKKWPGYGGANGPAMATPSQKNGSASASASANTPPIVPLPGDVIGFTLSPNTDATKPPKPRRSRTAEVLMPAWKRAKFEEFWDAVWAKLSKHESEQEWATCATTPDEADRIIAACKAQAPRLKAEGDRRIAQGQQGHLHPNRWLKRKRYDDEAPVPVVVEMPSHGEPSYTPAYHREYVEPEWMKPGYDPDATA